MDIGGKLKAARLEAGLSQRQLCGEIITRNMLSQIENGSAQPSMETLCQLAARLGKTVLGHRRNFTSRGHSQEFYEGH